MDFSHKTILDLMLSQLNEEEMLPHHIPNLDLYMDQIITIFHAGDKTLTKTMINNYSKDGVLTPIKGKKYSKEQVMRILFIYLLKQTLSIQEIKHLLNGLEIQGDEPTSAALSALYLAHIEEKKQGKDDLTALVSSFALQDMEKNDLLPLLLSLSWVSDCTKRMCQSLVATYFIEEDGKKA